MVESVGCSVALDGAFTDGVDGADGTVGELGWLGDGAGFDAGGLDVGTTGGVGGGGDGGVGTGGDGAGP
jgi:hypothetical protein